TILILLCPVFLFSTAAASEFYTLSLHDALPIYTSRSALLITRSGFRGWGGAWIPRTGETATWPTPAMWSRQRGWPTRWPGSLNREDRSMWRSHMTHSPTKNCTTWRASNLPIEAKLQTIWHAAALTVAGNSPAARLED